MPGSMVNTKKCKICFWFSRISGQREDKSNLSKAMSDKYQMSGTNNNYQGDSEKQETTRSRTMTKIQINTKEIGEIFWLKEQH